MEYLLIKQPWANDLKNEDWFLEECVRYPVGKDTPAFLKKAYFVPQHRLMEHPRFSMIYLGSYSSFAFIWKQTQADRQEMATV